MFAISKLCLLFLASVACATPLASPRTSNQLARRDGTGSVTGAGLQWYSSSVTSGGNGYKNPNTYKCYSGPASNFPPISSWMNFNSMFALMNRSALTPVGDTPAQITNLRSAILDISSVAKVDPRVILAVVILESTGNFSVGCTTSYGGVANCGLMQSYNPVDTAYDPAHPVKSTNLMIQDGTQGTPNGPGLVQWFNHAADVSFNTNGNVYAALRGYNSGAQNVSNLSDGKGANPAYVSNIANYLQGWQGFGTQNASKCAFPTNASPAPSPTACLASNYAPAPTQTVSGTTPDCCKWYTTKSGDNCYNIDTQYGISLSQFRSWNTYIDADCSNLFVNYAYCVSGNAVPPSSSSPAATMTSTTVSSSGSKTSSVSTRSSSVSTKPSANKAFAQATAPPAA